MNSYFVEITAEIPYPWRKSYRQDATNEGVAIARSLKAYRQDLKRERGKARRISEFSLKVRRESRTERTGEGD